GDQTSHWFDRSGFREGAVGNDHSRGGAVQTRRVAGRNCSSFAEGRTQLGQHVDGRVGPRRLIHSKRFYALLAANLDRGDLLCELAGPLRRAEALLRSGGEPVLHLAGELSLRDEILRMPTRVFA